MNDAKRVPSAVFAASLVLYLALRSRFYNFDGVACAIAVDLSDFKHLVHGNHLAYGLVAWAFTRLIAWPGPSLEALQVLSGLLGAAGAAAFSSLLLRSGRSVRESLLGGAALALSHAWWFWSLEAQVYMLGALFLVLAAREALSENPRPWLVGLLHAGAILGHVGHLMAAPALLYALCAGGRLKAARGWLAAVAAAVGAAYALAAVFAVRPASLEEVRLWLLGSAALGYDRAFAWHGAPFGESLTSWLRLCLEVFVSRPFSWLALIPLAAAGRGLLRGGRPARFWGLWLAGYAALFLFWEPATLVYRITDLIALYALAFEGLGGLPASARAALLAAWCALLAGLNLRGAVLPAGDPARNPDLARAAFLRERTPGDAWVLAVGRGQVFVPYFARRRPLNPRYWSDEAGLFARLDALAAAGSPVFATEDALLESGWRASFVRYGLRPEGAPGLYRVVRAAASRKGKAGRN